MVAPGRRKMEAGDAEVHQQLLRRPEPGDDHQVFGQPEFFGYARIIIEQQHRCRVG
jgi:hypothetical protein